MKLLLFFFTRAIPRGARAPKNEAGMSGMLKNINDEAVKQGEEVMKTIKKLATALDKGREMSIQEAIYRSLGLKMT